MKFNIGDKVKCVSIDLYTGFPKYETGIIVRRQPSQLSPIYDVEVNGNVKFFMEYEIELLNQCLQIDNQYNPQTGFWNESTISQIQSKECQHEYKTYIGMIETFDYCIKCDLKKSR